MPLAAAQVRSWLQAQESPLSISAAAAGASMSRIALSQQLMRGRVTESVIVSSSRIMGLDPLAELAGFEEYADLMPANPATREALACIDWPELFQAVGMSQRGLSFGDRDLGPVTFPNASRIWVDALDAGSGALRASVATALGTSTSSIAHSITAGLKPHLAAEFSRQAGTPVASALVVSGLITSQEAGWTRDARSRAVLATPMPELLELVGIRSTSALRAEKRVRSFEEELG